MTIKVTQDLDRCAPALRVCYAIFAKAKLAPYSAPSARWTLELLADELVRLTVHDSISRETVRRRLAENEIQPLRQDMWCIPQVDGEYVARVEDAPRPLRGNPRFQAPRCLL